MNEEYLSLLENDTWDLVPLPKGRKLVRCEWVYRTKFGPDGKVDKHKAHLVSKRFSQVEGIDYTKSFSHVAKMNSILHVFSLSPSFKWEVHQMDVKSTFLHGDLHEEIYMEQPPGFIQTNSNLVCRLNKSLYGLKQAPRAWHSKTDSFLLDTHFSMCHSDDTVYTKKVGKSLIILYLYVNDLILMGSDPNLINHVMSSLKKNFEMTGLGHLHCFRGLPSLAIQGSGEASPLLVGFTNSYWVSDPDDRKSTTGYVFTLASRPIAWACKKQSAICPYLVEVEYRGTIEASKEAMWLRQFLLEFDFQQ
eukprot:PITA_18946